MLRAALAWIVKRGPRRYKAVYRAPDGRERSQTFERRTDAERWVSTQSSDVIRGGWTDPRLGRMTFAEWVQRWERTIVLRPTTRALNMGVIRTHLLPRFGAWPVNTITTADVKVMLAEELAAGRLSASAIRRHVIVLSTILQGAVADGRIARNPCAGVKLPPENAREMRFLEPVEVRSVADSIRPLHYRPLVLTAAYPGLRWGEPAGLPADRVDLLHPRIRVEQQLVEVAGRLTFGPPKTKAGRRAVSVPSALAEILEPHLFTPPVRRSGLAFPTPSGVAMRRSGFRPIWRRACTEAGFDTTRLDGLVFHELRHTAAALAIAQGAHPLAVMERLGHSSITVTMDRYGGLFPHLDEAISEGLDDVLRRAAASPLPERPQVRHLPS